MTKIAVVTIAAGRHRHLQTQREHLARSDRQPDQHVIVSMGDPEIQRVAAASGSSPHHVIALETGPRLPLAAARNAGAAAAARLGSDLLIFLDIDCLPDPLLVSRYLAAATARPPMGGVFAGPIAYLPPAGTGGYPSVLGSRYRFGHPGRPVPAEDAIEACPDPWLFWSLSFAVTVSAWEQIGGFDESYQGYGGEDTDFAMRFTRAGLSMWWVGGAWAYHQYHASPDPPVQHVADIVRNATRFHRQWGWWPMLGWLEAFEHLGIAYRDSTGAWHADAIDA